MASDCEHCQMQPNQIDCEQHWTGKATSTPSDTILVNVHAPELPDCMVQWANGNEPHCC